MTEGRLHGVSGRLDLVVVGGGIIGTMTALLALERHPGWRVLLVDRSLIGAGASLYSAYMDYPYGPSAAKRDLAERSARLYARLRAELALPIEDLPLIGVCAAEKLDAVSAGLVGAPRGEPWTERTRALLAEALPGFVAPAGSVVIPGLAAARCTDRALPGKIAAALAASGRRTCLEGIEVVHVAPGRGGLEVQARDGRAFEAPRVALCLGPWLPGSLQGLARATVPVRVKKIVSLHVPIVPPAGAPLVYLFDEEAFLLPQPEERRWLFSFRSEAWDCEPEVSRLHITAQEWDRAAAILGRYLPASTGLPLGGRVFCDAYTATGEPFIQPLEGLPGCVVAGGGSGSGYRLAPAIAEQAIGLLSEDSAHSRGTP